MNLTPSRKHMVIATASIAASAAAGFLLMAQAALPENCFKISMPPARYDYDPGRNFVDIRMRSANVDAACRRRADFSYMRVRLESCVTSRTGEQTVRITPNDVSPPYRDCLIRHENGHVNGWGARHEGARWYSTARPIDRYGSGPTFYGF